MYGDAAEWKDKEKQFRFRNGAVFHMAYLENDADAMNYQGWSLTRVYVEELTQYACSAGIFRLFATLRTTIRARCQFRATCNPGGPGHHWVKNWVIDNGAYRPVKDPETGFIRIFIPAKISDNPSLLNNDPELHQPAAGLGLPRPRQGLARRRLEHHRGRVLPRVRPRPARHHPAAYAAALDPLPHHGLGLRLPLLHRLVGGRAGGHDP